MAVEKFVCKHCGITCIGTTNTQKKPRQYCSVNCRALATKIKRAEVQPTVSQAKTST